MIVTLKYVLLVMRADNHGEGGIMALVALVERALKGRRKVFLVLVGILGASLFYGDGMITPAISVLSAVAGLQVASPGLASEVVPISLAVLVALFLLQQFGTGAVGALFGPIMAVWFVIIGAVEVLQHPGILRALSPTYGVSFLAGDPRAGFLSLGAVVLAITGAEALYADMGHFGRKAITRAWLGLVFPALVLNYMGQGALIMAKPATVDNPFFRLLPAWSQISMVVLATVATIIASQAVISGAFSLTQQAVQLGFLPRVAIRHTSSRVMGQIYVPAVNWFLLVAVIALVLGFRSLSALASAYGIAVTGTFATNTLLAFVLFHVVWRKPLWMTIAGAAVFLTIELTFFAANLTKIVSGGWLPLVVGAAAFTVLTTWRRGRSILARATREDRVQLRRYINRLIDDPPVRVPGTAVFLANSLDTVPPALLNNVKHNRVLHDQVVLLKFDGGHPARALAEAAVHTALPRSDPAGAVLRHAGRPSLRGRHLRRGLSGATCHPAGLDQRRQGRVQHTRGEGLHLRLEQRRQVEGVAGQLDGLHACVLGVGTDHQPGGDQRLAVPVVQPIAAVVEAREGSVAGEGCKARAGDRTDLASLPDQATGERCHQGLGRVRVDFAMSRVVETGHVPCELDQHVLAAAAGSEDRRPSPPRGLDPAVDGVIIAVGAARSHPERVDRVHREGLVGVVPGGFHVRRHERQRVVDGAVRLVLGVMVADHRQADHVHGNHPR